MTPRPWLTRNLLALGLVSLLTDAATEMVVPFLPFFLMGVLQAGAAAAGWIEGLADALASTLKLFAGRLADRLGRNRPLVLVGYGLSSAARPLVALAASPVHVLLVRLVDRTGKGLRSSPRDALIAASTDPEHHARAFALHRAMDHAGAVVGPLLALAVLTLWTRDLRVLFALAAVPGALAVLTILTSVREPDAPTLPAEPAGPVEPRRPWARPAAGLRPLLVAVGALGLGRPNEALLLPALGEARAPLAAVPLLWVGLHVVKVIASLASGGLAERFGRRALVAIGWSAQALALLGLALVESREATWALFLAAGVGPGLSEGPEKALVARLAPEGERATSFGWYHLVAGVAALPASVAFGVIWERWSGPTALSAAAALVALGVLLLGRVRGA
jgi:MFS family permease